MQHPLKSMAVLHKALFELRRHGAWNTLHWVLLGAINAIVLCKILRAVFVDCVDVKFLSYPDHFSVELLTPQQIRQFAKNPAYDMSESFVEEALARGDECFAVRDRDTLAAYGWYAFGPTSIGLGNLSVYFSAATVYMYKGFTHEKYRGQRLHAIGMTTALRHYLSKGLRGLVSYVESTNFDSLKSCYRMGYSVFGSVYVVRIGGRHFTFSSPGCRRFAFSVAPVVASGVGQQKAKEAS